ncbi:MAG: histidine phosphatase family protein [Janibacter sp.]|jgi:broad specificity phosphatase PhoE|uniref:Histidine phosphatase family protein n=1 Tax=Janibacter limosus TaxID=53458 RepID=A0A4P6MY82_9MICO|nr:histidine phosphatase family protein [Janibacter limosus]MDN5717537.1 histidine phosphatase family protein [Janibacter sp.]QBF47047.1 histidine phosphatase family protein [Janibacter limosus]
MTEPLPDSGTDLPVDTESPETAAQAAGAASEAAEGAREAHAEHGARPGSERTVVHLLRHGEVDNPDKVLYGRLPDYHLSALGREMAEVVAERLAEADLALVVHSPLERTAETAAPTLARHGLTAVVDPRVIEAGNKFEGRRFRKRLLLDPRRWWWLRDPTKPTWGEPYRAIGKRMMAAIEDARDHARGHEVLIVSHQLPIWTIRSVLEHRNLWHDPRKRECNLASLTSVTFTGDEITDVTYSEPAAHLYAQAATIPGA